MRKFGQFGVHGSPTLLYGIADDLLRRLQSVQNAAARLVAGSRRSDHITPVLRRLHWLPVRRIIEFKLALLIHKSLNGSIKFELTPRYLSDDCMPVSQMSVAVGSFSWCFHLCGPAHSHRLWWPGLPSRWTLTLEQSAGFTVTVWHDSRPVQETA